MALTDEESSIVNAVASDPELSSKAKVIASLMLERVERIVRHGNDQSVMQLAGRVMPALMKSIGDRGNDDELKATFFEMREEIRNAVRPVDTEGRVVATEDRPIGVELDDEAPSLELALEPVFEPPPKKRAGGKGRPERLRTSTRAAGGART